MSSKLLGIVSVIIEVIVIVIVIVIMAGNLGNPNNLSFAPTTSGGLVADWIDLDDIFSSTTHYYYYYY